MTPERRRHYEVIDWTVSLPSNERVLFVMIGPVAMEYKLAVIDPFQYSLDGKDTQTELLRKPRHR